MDLETFLHHLHFDTEKVSPPDWQVDWEDAPLPYKLYRGLPEVPLTADSAFNTREKGRTSKSQHGGAWSFPMVCIRAYSIFSIRFKRGNE